MKIVSDDNTFIIPMNDNNKIIISSDYLEDLIECLSSYFVMKKKTKCMIYDDDGNKLSMDDVNFIYLPGDTSLENNLSFKAKTILNSEITEIIKNNPDYFISLEVFREQLLNITSDKGFYKLRNILSNGLNKIIDLELKEFSINLFLQFFEIHQEELSDLEKKIIIYNALLFVNRNKTNIVYIDDLINDSLMIDWINTYSNVFVLLDNNSLLYSPEQFDFLILSNNDHIITEEENSDNIRVLSYMNHNIIKANISLQNEKNVELFHKYHDNYSTFFIKNNSLQQ